MNNYRSSSLGGGGEGAANGPNSGPNNDTFSHEVVPVVGPAGHAGVLARLILLLVDAQRAVEPLWHLSKPPGDEDQRAREQEPKSGKRRRASRFRHQRAERRRANRWANRANAETDKQTNNGVIGARGPLPYVEERIARAFAIRGPDRIN